MNNSRPNSRPNLKIGRGRGREKLSPPAPGIHGAGNPGRLLLGPEELNSDVIVNGVPVGAAVTIMFCKPLDF